jgi:uncharacterized protein YraI
MRRLGFLLAAVVMLLAAGAAGAQSADTLTSFAQRGNLRTGPGVEWATAGTYDPGTPFRADGQAFSGAWVRGIAPDGTVGWVFAEALALSPADAAALRPVYLETPFTLSAPQGGPAPAAPAQQPAAPPSQPNSAPPAVSGGGGGPVQTTTAAGVNMRTAPNSSIIRRLAFDEAITVDGRSADGGWVRVSTGDGARGWVALDYVVLTGQQFSTLPVVEGGAIQPQASAPAADAPAGAPAAPVVSTAPISGFSYGGHIASLNDGTIQRMREAGMTWIKTQVRYRPGVDVTGIINAAHGAGFRILLGIVGDPAQVMDGGYQDAFAAYLGSVAAAGADAIEVWNEPNIDREWPSGSISAQAFTGLLRRAYSAIKAANPNTLIISGAPAPTGYFGGCGGGGCDDNLFIAGMAAAGAANYVDCVGIHYNEGIVPPSATSGDPRGSSSHYSRYLGSMISTYNSAFGRARPLCFTELGYLSPEGFGPLPGGFAWAQNVTVAQQAAWLADAIRIARSRGVRLVIVWNVDFTTYDADPMAGYAMIRPDGSCPACAALGR